MKDRQDSSLFGLSQRQPPTNLQAEQALLGALLANNRAYERVSEFLAPEHFADPIHSRIFQSIGRRIDAGQLADAVTLKAEYEHAGVLEEVGGTRYLAQLLTAMVGIINAGEYGKAIYDAWLRRQAIDVGEAIVNNAFGADPSKDGQSVVDEAIDNLLGLSEGSASLAGSESMDDAVDEVLDQANAAAAGRKGAGLSTGLPTLDALWRGLWPGTFVLFGARSMHGKSAFMMQLAPYVAAGLLEEHRAIIAAGAKWTLGNVHINSLEMPKRDLALRMLASETGISSADIREGHIGGNRGGLLVEARLRLRGLPMKVNDTARTIGEICRSIRVGVRRNNAKIAIIDHLHRIRPDKAMGRLPRVEQIGLMAQMLKDTAKACDIPIVALAQCRTRGEVAQREDKRPVVSDILYASDQDADDIVLMWRPEIDMGSRPPEARPGTSEEKEAELANKWWARKNSMRGKAEFIMAKARFGTIGSCMLGFDGPRTRFYELEQDQTAQAGDPGSTAGDFLL